MTRVVALILHARSGPDAGLLTEAFGAIRLRNGERQAAGFAAAGIDDVRLIDEPPDPRGFGWRVRDVLGATAAEGLVVLGSGSIPLATAADRRAFVAVAAGPTGHALANNRYSADVVAIAGAEPLAALPDLAADNGLPRWLADNGFAVDDRRARWRLQMDLDTPLDAILCEGTGGGSLAALAASTTERIRSTLARIQAVLGDTTRELVVAGRMSAAGLAWLERSTASRTRALIEERGFRTRRPDLSQRPTRSSLGLLLDHRGPAALGSILAELGDGALVDTRVLLAHRFGTNEAGWPVAEDRFASDLLLPERIADPWLRALTAAAADAEIPIVLGGHSLVGPGLRLALDPGRRWT